MSSFSGEVDAAQWDEVSAAQSGERNARRPFVEALERLGAWHYHHRHPFNALMHAGLLGPSDLRAWVENRYYYQTRIPIKDALIIAKSEDSDFRRTWLRRIIDHDGLCAGEGGLESWRRLALGCGCDLERLESHAAVEAGVVRACDDYVALVRSLDLVAAVASSLTEYFAAGLMRERIGAWRRHYPFVADDALAYFRQRVNQASADAAFALQFVVKHAVTPESRAACLRAFRTKCSLLWRLLDAVYVQCRRQRRPSLTRRVMLRETGETGSADGERGGTRAVLVMPEKALCLNDVAHRLIELCDGRTTLQELVARLADEHETAIATVEQDVATFVAELEQRRVLAFDGAEK